MKCAYCDTPLPKDKNRCPSCRQWNMVSPWAEEGDTVLLSDARLTSTKRLNVGFLNPIFGGGLAITSSNLLAGQPGAGKTTLFLQIIDMIAPLYPDRECLHIATEQQAEDIKVIAERINMKCKHQTRIVKALGGLKRTLEEYYNQYNPFLLIIDSLSKLAGEDLELQVKIAAAVKEFNAQRPNPCPALIVNQVNKQEDHAGLMKLQHEVDALFTIDYDKTDPSGERFIFVTKNRFGQAPLGLTMRMTANDEEIPGLLVPCEEKDG